MCSACRAHGTWVGPCEARTPAESDHRPRSPWACVGRGARGCRRTPRRAESPVTDLRSPRARTALFKIYSTVRGIVILSEARRRQRAEHGAQGAARVAWTVASRCPSGGRRTIRARSPSVTSSVKPGLPPDSSRGQRRSDIGGCGRGGPGTEPAEVGRAARPGWEHRPSQGTITLTVSATQTGLSAPSRSTVTREVDLTPFGPGASESSSTPALTRDPVGTGEGKRTLSQP